jgi:hypothetical protein
MLINHPEISKKGHIRFHWYLKKKPFRAPKWLRKAIEKNF